MTRHGSGLVVVALLLAWAAEPSPAQAPLPTWRLTGPRLEFGRDDVELHRVRAAAFLPNGQVAVADAGNHRVLVVSPQGRLLRQFGREGRGPGDISSLIGMATFGDTLVVYDSGVQRLTLWNSAGDVLRSNTLPGVTGRTPMAVAMLSPSSFLVSYAHNTGSGQPAGLFVQQADLHRYDGRTNRSTPLGTPDWTYLYHYPEENGSTTYGASFLGTMLLAGNGSRWLTVPLGSTTATIHRADGTTGAAITIPEAQRPYDRVLVDRYRDSLVALTRPRADQFPGAIERLERVFGPTFPVPERRSALAIARTVGREVWLKAFPTRQSAEVTWYVVDLQAERLVARLVLPNSWQVLGGDQRSVLVLRRDEFDTEYVAVYDIAR